MPYSSLEIANEFLRLAQEEGIQLTQMQLQKLVYLAHGYSLAIEGEPLVEDNVEAWDYGTVFRPLWNALTQYGNAPVPGIIRWGDGSGFIRTGGKEANERLSPAEKAIVGKVWDIYGRYPAFKLSALTHDQNGPWKRHYVKGENRVIPNDSIREYFRNLIRSQTNGKNQTSDRGY
jgi:uncharacterized phage-associated protein